MIAQNYKKTANTSAKFVFATAAILVSMFIVDASFAQASEHGFIHNKPLHPVPPIKVKSFITKHRNKMNDIETHDSDSDVVCTQDAKLCPDGSSVGRVGPNCEFAKCPGERRGKVRNIFNRLKEKKEHQLSDWRKENRAVKGEVIKLREHIKKRRAEIKDTVRAKRDEFKNALKNAKTPEEKKDILKQIKAKRDEFKAKIKAERKELRDKIKQRVSIHLQRVMKRLSAILERLKQINHRIQNHLDKLAERGIDTSSAQAAKDRAKEAVLNSEDLVSQAKHILEEAVSAQNPAEYRDKVRTAVRSAIQGIKDAKTAIRDAIKAARALKPQKDN